MKVNPKWRISKDAKTVATQTVICLFTLSRIYRHTQQHVAFKPLGGWLVGGLTLALALFALSTYRTGKSLSAADAKRATDAEGA